MCCLVDISDGK